MFSEVYYLIRSRSDGKYLTARLNPNTLGYLLLFREHFDAQSYLNTHATELSNRFAIESVPGSQVGNLLKRWGFNGIAVVSDPLIPTIEFLQQ
jgi:hypothetical protein